MNRAEARDDWNVIDSLEQENEQLRHRLADLEADLAMANAQLREAEARLGETCAIQDLLPPAGAAWHPIHEIRWQAGQ
jgi:hypothetical protein